MRPIDADALLKAFYRELDNAILYGRIVKPLQDLIKEAPTIGAVPVVRCKDCFLYGECKAAEFYGDDGFCSVGERRDDG